MLYCVKNQQKLDHNTIQLESSEAKLPKQYEKGSKSNDSNPTTQRPRGKRNIRDHKQRTQRGQKGSSATGNRTPVSRVTGRDTSHYTIADLFCLLRKKVDQSSYTENLFWGPESRQLQVSVHFHEVRTGLRRGSAQSIPFVPSSFFDA
jgi:hypothetical protein